MYWLRAAAQHAEEIEEILIADNHLNQGQLDALWSYVAHKGKKGYPETDEKGGFGRATMIEPSTRLRAARGMGKSETKVAIEVFQTREKGCVVGLRLCVV